MKSKIKRKKPKARKIILTAIFSLSILGLAFFSLPKTRAVVSWGAGWGKGIWNNYIAGYDEDDPSFSPTIGWLKSSSNTDGPCMKDADYEIYFEDSGTVGTRYVSGRAWFGIGSQPDNDGTCDVGAEKDLPSLGWLDFDANPGTLCEGQGDCHAARWHKDGDDDHSGYLDGYAHIRSMEENGWVRLRGDNNGEKYAVRVDNDGILSGYAWNSGAEIDPSLVGNQGLGWIKMDGLQIAECELDASTKELCEGESFEGSSCSSGFCPGGATCTPDMLDANHFKTWTCTRGCGSKPGVPVPIVPETGQCGSFNGNSICDKNNVPAGKLCASGTPSTPNYTALTSTWTCGNDCGKKVECSASTKCGWTEINP